MTSAAAPRKFLREKLTQPRRTPNASSSQTTLVTLQYEYVIDKMADRTSPTPLAMLIGTAIIAGISGYMIGIASSLGFFPIPFLPKAPKERGISNYDDEEESEDEDIDESILDHAPNWANGLEADKRDGLRATEAKKEEPVKTGWEDSTEECKLVLVVRTDLGMTKGILPPLPSHSSMSNVDFSR
jgi:PTH2 family peptidyl-tRNA hydrolase